MEFCKGLTEGRGEDAARLLGFCNSLSGERTPKSDRMHAVAQLSFAYILKQRMRFRNDNSQNRSR